MVEQISALDSCPRATGQDPLDFNRSTKRSSKASFLSRASILGLSARSMYLILVSFPTVAVINLNPMVTMATCSTIWAR